MPTTLPNTLLIAAPASPPTTTETPSPNQSCFLRARGPGDFLLIRDSIGEEIPAFQTALHSTYVCVCFFLFFSFLLVVVRSAVFFSIVSCSYSCSCSCSYLLILKKNWNLWGGLCLFLAARCPNAALFELFGVYIALLFKHYNWNRGTILILRLKTQCRENSVFSLCFLSWASLVWNPFVLLSVYFV